MAQLSSKSKRKQDAHVAQVIVYVTPELKALIADEVGRRTVSMNEFLIGMLADTFGVPFEAGVRRGKKGLGPSTAIVMRMPRPLRSAIQEHAARSGLSDNDVMVGVFVSELARRSKSPVL